MNVFATKKTRLAPIHPVALVDLHASRKKVDH